MNGEIKKLLISGIKLVMLFLIIIFIYSFIIANYSETKNLTIWEKQSFELKDDISRQKGSPKIIIVGGSNVLFGISAKQIEQKTGMGTVNYAIHAGLGDYTFERVKRIAKPGDTIILALEYEQYWYDKKFIFEKQTIKERYILTHDKDYFNSLSLFEKANILMIGIEDLILNIRSQSRPPRKQYDAETLNAWGDETVNFGNPVNFTAFPIKFPIDFIDDFLEYDGVQEIIDFSLWADKNNVKILATFPSTVYFSDYNDLIYRKNFRLIEVFYEKLGISLLGNPTDFLYDQELFYDTKYHLNDKGRGRRTKTILDDLRKLSGS